MKHLLIILISILLLSSFLTSCDKKEETLYRWGEYPEIVWIGDKETLPKYEGDVENGKPNGVGILIFPSGSKYVGEWKDGKRTGHGTFTSHEGWKYVGEYKDDKRHGQGTYTFSDGRKYEGEWKDGKMNGQGTITYPYG